MGYLKITILGLFENYNTWAIWKLQYMGYLKNPILGLFENPHTLAIWKNLKLWINAKALVQLKQILQKTLLKHTSTAKT